MATKKTRLLTTEEIIREYISFHEDHGEPDSVQNFCESQNIEQDQFFTYFETLNDLERAAWTMFFEETIGVLHRDEGYDAFPVREKLLAYYYTHIEVLNQYRKYILQKRQSWLDSQPLGMKDYRHQFCAYVDDLVQEGLLSGEVADRKFITDWYKEGFWIQLLFVIRFWSHDDSDQFELTDAAIEKAVNLSFELIAWGPLEAMVDFAKFVIQNR